MSNRSEIIKLKLAQFRETYIGPHSTAGGVILALITTGIWIWRKQLFLLYQERTALIPATFVAVAIAIIIMLAGLWIEHIVQRRFWLVRGEQRIGVEELAPPTRLERLQQRFPDPLERLFGPLLRTRVGQRFADEWIDARFGRRPSRYLLLLMMVAVIGGFVGFRIGGSIIGIVIGLILPLLSQQYVRSRANVNRRRFGEQVPQALDAIAAGLAAGLSFPQAVEYAADEVPEPIDDAIARLSRRISLGHPVDEALQRMHEDHPEESLALVVDGIALQRQFGGDLVTMLDQTATLLRERVELEREVRAVTSQGRLSGWVVAALVPVSAGILLFSNPVYLDVLFDTIIGQFLVVFSLVLQLTGWAIISRLVRIRY
jgi:tight adherence protein B